MPFRSNISSTWLIVCCTLFSASVFSGSNIKILLNSSKTVLPIVLSILISRSELSFLFVDEGHVSLTSTGFELL